MIYIITHKECKLPEIIGYIPLLVGAHNKDNRKYLRDDTGDNISQKNADYCELTGVYWIWKNVHDDYKGIVHYRRFFSTNRMAGNVNSIIPNESLIEWLEEYDVIVTYLEHVRFSLKEKLIRYHCDEIIYNTLRDTVETLYPDYIDCFDDTMSGNTMSICNMMYCRKELFDSYCGWLFSILCELEKRITDGQLKYQPRLYGYLSERLLNVWLRYNKLNCKRQPIMNTEMNSAQRLKWIATTYISELTFKLRGKMKQMR